MRYESRHDKVFARESIKKKGSEIQEKEQN